MERAIPTLTSQAAFFRRTFQRFDFRFAQISSSPDSLDSFSSSYRYSTVGQFFIHNKIQSSELEREGGREALARIRYCMYEAEFPTLDRGECQTENRKLHSRRSIQKHGFDHGMKPRQQDKFTRNGCCKRI